MPRTTLSKSLLPVGVILVAVGAGLVVIRAFVTPQHLGGTQVSMRLGESVGDLTLTRFGSGEKIKISKLGAKVILLNFWATWCEACLVEMPSIVKLRNAYASKGFEVAPINVDENPSAVVPRVAALLKINFPIYVDEGQTLSQLFNVRGIPLTIILNREGKLLHIETGERDWFSDDVKTEVERWLRAGP